MSAFTFTDRITILTEESSYRKVWEMCHKFSFLGPDSPLIMPVLEA